jgi:hypothetical protein
MAPGGPLRVRAGTYLTGTVSAYTQGGPLALVAGASGCSGRLALLLGPLSYEAVEAGVEEAYRLLPIPAYIAATRLSTKTLCPPVPSSNCSPSSGRGIIQGFSKIRKPTSTLKILMCRCFCLKSRIDGLFINGFRKP